MRARQRTTTERVYLSGIGVRRNHGVGTNARCSAEYRTRPPHEEEAGAHIPASICRYTDRSDPVFRTNVPLAPARRTRSRGDGCHWRNECKCTEITIDSPVPRLYISKLAALNTRELERTCCEPLRPTLNHAADALPPVASSPAPPSQPHSRCRRTAPNTTCAHTAAALSRAQRGRRRAVTMA